MSCLFDSLSVYFRNIESNTLRNKICDYLQTNPKILDDIDTSSVIQWEQNTNISLDDYVKRMRKSSSWGGSIEIKCFCDMYNYDVVVIFNNETIEHKSKGISKYIIYLKYNGSHYEPFAIQKKK